MPEVSNISDIPRYDPYNPLQRTVTSELGKWAWRINSPPWPRWRTFKPC
jgi:hypothetical protein